MAIIPRAYQRQVRLDPVPAAYQSVQTSAEMFGGGIGRGLQDFGQGVQRLGAAGLEIATEEAIRENEAAAVAADAEAADAIRGILFDPETGFLNAQGRNAIDRYAATEQQIGEAMERIGAGLPTDRSRELFMAQATRRAQRAMEGAQRHVSTQRAAYEAAASEARIHSSRQDAFAAFADDETIQVSIATIQAEIRQRAEREGWHQDTTVAVLDEQESAVHAGVIARRLDNNQTQSALAYLERHRNGMTGTDLAALDGMVTAAREQRSLITEFESIWAGTWNPGQQAGLTAGPPDLRASVPREAAATGASRMPPLRADGSAPAAPVQPAETRSLGVDGALPDDLWPELVPEIPEAPERPAELPEAPVPPAPPSLAERYTAAAETILQITDPERRRQLFGMLEVRYARLATAEQLQREEAQQEAMERVLAGTRVVDLPPSLLNRLPFGSHQQLMGLERRLATSNIVTDNAAYGELSSIWIKDPVRFAQIPIAERYADRLSPDHVRYFIDAQRGVRADLQAGLVPTNEEIALAHAIAERAIAQVWDEAGIRGNDREAQRARAAISGRAQRYIHDSVRSNRGVPSAEEIRQFVAPLARRWVLRGEDDTSDDAAIPQIFMRPGAVPSHWPIRDYRDGPVRSPPEQEFGVNLTEEDWERAYLPFDQIPIDIRENLQAQYEEEAAAEARERGLPDPVIDWTDPAVRRDIETLFVIAETPGLVE